jgi:UDP-3-O-[3-hydroxymyristoyl] glucosamine N-acyltransferase
MSPTPSFSATDLASRVNGTLIGSGNLQVTSVSPLDARTSHSLSFIRTTSKDLITREIAGRAGQILLVPSDIAPSSVDGSDVALIAVKDPYIAFLDLLPLFHPEREVPREIHPTAIVHPSATIGKEVAIGAHCIIGEGVTIGDGCILHPLVSVYRDVTLGSCVTLHSGVSIREGSVLGNHITIHNNSVIGADGFGYVPDLKLGLRKVPHLGNVVLEDHVEVGASTSIDRGAFGSTRIGFGTKIDNQVQIGHNVVIGKFCVICGQTGIAGSVTIGDQCVFGGGAGAVDHVTICSNARFGGRAGAGGDITEPGDYLGFPAIKASQWKRSQAVMRRLANPGKRSKQ